MLVWIEIDPKRLIPNESITYLNFKQMLNRNAKVAEREKRLVSRECGCERGFRDTGKLGFREREDWLREKEGRSGWGGLACMAYQELSFHIRAPLLLQVFSRLSPCPWNEDHYKGRGGYFADNVVAVWILHDGAYFFDNGEVGLVGFSLSLETSEAAFSTSTGQGNLTPPANYSPRPPLSIRLSPPTLSHLSASFAVQGSHQRRRRPLRSIVPEGTQLTVLVPNTLNSNFENSSPYDPSGRNIQP
ncbi:hypothetical protein Nepgr_029519 [Nepenthes gracilis]|uniref:Uncharacterized protein n=1 Tax=Nepenthes gracilis TaxID=150966 RepID=A0AAD3Y5M0_NEPGR|nr:hypothetical protein Nepgr_029519 [Nepenthes gracilis]